MKRTNVSKNLIGLLLLSCLLIVLPLEIAAQCAGTYFKRLATTNAAVNGFILYSTDMTGDGIPDLVGYEGAQSSSNSGRIKLFISPANSNGTFGAPITFLPPPQKNFHLFIPGDYDNDNLKDIITSVAFPGSFIVYKNNGDDTFTTINVTNQFFGNFLYMMDINNDGKGDIIADWGGIEADVRYSLGNGDGSFQNSVPLILNRNILPGDFNTDGKIDFIAGTTLLINQGGGIFSTVSNALALANGEVIRDVRDFSGDGKPDILTVTQSSTVKISLLTNTGSNSFQRADYTIATNQQNSNRYGNVYAGNFGGSASADVLYSAEFQNKTIVFTNDGTGALAAQTYDYKFNGNFAGDYDNDGKTDAVRVSEGNSNPFARHKVFDELSLTVQKNVCAQPGQPQIVDFDRSGGTDYSYWTPADGKWAYLSNENPLGQSVSINWGLGSLGDIPAPGDFDGDGKTDRAVYRNSTGAWWILRSSDGQPSAVQFGLPGDKPVVGDYDGDSVSDLAVWRPSDGNWYVLFMGTQSYTIVHWGQSGDKPVPEDYDGDGKTDLAIFRPSTGTWYYLKSSDLNFVALQFGLAGDKPVAADYDGDGWADIAVYRESDHVLHILRSSNLAYAAFQFGVSQDVPQPGDYDGDFVFDFGVYRPSSQSWHLTTRSEQTNFGASNVIPTASMLKIE
ncbi:MAG TPA: VCBS repeat-containing protein [Pyrinomonadaceae bacterium]|jgi:hypothetical protein